MENLRKLEDRSIYIVREALNKYRSPAMLWSMGKDSTVLLWLCRKAFYGKIPFKVIHIDTGYKFKEMYDFRDRMKKLWKIDLVVSKNTETDASPEKNRFECCNARKTLALKKTIMEQDFDAILVGIRRDEHGIRNKERYFSPRDKDFRWRVSSKSKDSETGLVSAQEVELAGWNLFATDFGKEADHVRVHPLLHWTELDIWRYIEKENIPLPDLYFSKNSYRYRSIGCESCCSPIMSSANSVREIITELEATKTGEREGRAQDKEDEENMEKLRSLGYM